MTRIRKNIVLIILSATAGIMFLAPMIRFSFYDQMMEALRLTDIQIGTLGSVYGVAYVIAFAFSGISCHRSIAGNAL